ncbi:MAG: cytochrome c [Myxococcales bacterium]|nr:cytochrome c [Myxococcales bacterium]
MNHTKLTASVALTVLAALGVACGGGGGGAGADGGQVAEGHKQFKATCAVCHGPNGEGMPKLGKDLNNNEFTQNLSDDELVAFLKKGRPATDPLNERGVDMPPMGGNPTLTDADFAQIVAYVRTLQ